MQTIFYPNLLAMRQCGKPGFRQLLESGRELW
jgi:hypothetical protein